MAFASALYSDFTMKTTFYNLIISLFALYCSCSPLTGDAARLPDGDSVTVTFAVSCPETQIATRALDPSQEKAIRNLNVYLFHKTTDISKHIYSNDGTQRIDATLVKGEYDLFVIANAGGNLGELTREQAETRALNISDESDLTRNDALPMSARQPVTANQNAVIPVSLVRLTAKVEFSLTIAPTVSGQIVLQTVQLMNAPRSVSYFADNRTSGELLNFPKQNITGNTFSGTYYVPENLQGINAAIKDQKDKNPSNAPVGATYLYVQGTTYGRQVAYYIYLGGNNIDDFNIQRNHQYVVQANISGINTIDTRVSTVDLTFGAIKNPCNVGETVTSSVTLKCTNSPARQIYLSAMLAEGGGTLTVNGSAWTPGAAMPFCKGNEARTVPVTLVPNRSGLIRIRFTVSDDQGYITYLELTTYCQQSYPVTTVFSENSWSKTAHTPLKFSVNTNQQNNTSGFNIKYELLKGAGDMYYGSSIKLTDGQSLTSGSNNPSTGLTFPFNFTPTAIGTVSFRLTFTGANGQASVVEKTYDGIAPYKINITPDFAHIQPSGTSVTSDGYTGIYYKNFTVRLLASADKALVKPVSLNIGLQYKLGEYKTSLTPTITPQNKNGEVTINAGSKTGYTALITYAASCIGYNAGMGSKIIFPGFYMVPKQNYATGEHREDASITSYKITSAADNTIEYTLLTPPK